MTPPGFATVTHAVPLFATSSAVIWACTLVLDNTVVLLIDPFQYTAAFGPNPAPLTVRINAPLPGSALGGTRGWAISGTGLDRASIIVVARIRRTRVKEERPMLTSVAFGARIR